MDDYKSCKMHVLKNMNISETLQKGGGQGGWTCIRPDRTKVINPAIKYINVFCQKPLFDNDLRKKAFCVNSCQINIRVYIFSICLR